MADQTPDAHGKYRAENRQRFGRVTPFRLGIAVGMAGDSLPSPYWPGSRGDRNYLDGVAEGAARRARAILAAASQEPKP